MNRKKFREATSDLALKEGRGLQVESGKQVVLSRRKTVVQA